MQIMRPQLKILFVINSLGRGGTERSLAEMLSYFIQANIKPVIVCFNRYQEGVEQEVRKLGCKLYFLEQRNLLVRVYLLRRIITTTQPDLIHTALFEADLVGRLAAIGKPVKVISSLVNTTYDPIRLQDPNLKPIQLRVVQAIDSWTARYLTYHFHAVSEAAKMDAVVHQQIPPERITVVERGRNPDRLGQPGLERRRKARLQLGLQEDDEVIVNVGRQEYQKGQRYLIDAMETLTQTHPRLVLLIAGRQGNASAELKRLCQKANLNGQVQFLGYRDDIPEILAAADLFVFPSLYEGLPGAVIEAMALGLPIVASNIPPLREVVEKNLNALLVKATCSTELAQAIETLLIDQKRRLAFGWRSQTIFEERFTLEQSATRMIELYHRLTMMN